MGRRGYPPEFRRKVLDLVASGRKVAEMAFDLEISDQTIYSWLRQDRIDRGLEQARPLVLGTLLGAALGSYLTSTRDRRRWWSGPWVNWSGGSPRHRG